MHIFIDESGTFTHPADSPHAVSLVGALIIPDSVLSSLGQKYARLRTDLPMENGEVKGRLLSESQIADVISLLSRHQVLYLATAIDMGIHTASDVVAHRAAQAERITGQLTPRHHRNLVRGVWELRRRLERMSPQLYVQSVVTFSLIDRVIREATLFYAQRIPKELGAFHWVIDGKDRKGTTDWESWWSYVVRPFTQSASLRKPMIMLREADYSHFRRFDTEFAEYLEPYAAKPKAGTGDRLATDLNLLMTESFRFSGNAEPGLELVDILVNATRRALMGSLDIRGWRDIPCLMIHTRGHYIEVIALHKRPGRAPSYMAVLRHFSKGGKDMIAPRFRRQKDARLRPYR